MKKIFVSFFVMTALVTGLLSCETDDTDDFSKYINNPESSNDDPADDPSGDDPSGEEKEDSVLLAGSDTIYVVYSGNTATVTGDEKGYVSISGADVTVNALAADTTMLLVLSGSSEDGCLLVYRQKPFTIQLNGLQLTNPDGPAINNQCGKALYIETVEGTENTLGDGSVYAEAPVNSLGVAIDQKGALFSEGQIFFCGLGSLTVNGNAKNGIVSDDYIVFEKGTVSVNVAETGSNGVKVNDGLTIQGGTLTVKVASDGGRGIKSDAYTTITGGTTNIITSGDCKLETIDGVRDTASAAGVKSDSLFTMTGGSLTIKCTGDGGKGINCAQNVEVSGGSLNITTTGSNDVGKPKGIKSDTGIIVSGGSFYVSVKKSWACDNGVETEVASARLTVVGEPSTKSIGKKLVNIKY